MNQLDFLAVGDITTDSFIKLKDAWVETDNPEHAEELCMRFGEKIPYESVTVVRAVGNSPNAAVAAVTIPNASLSFIASPLDHVGGLDALHACDLHRRPGARTQQSKARCREQKRSALHGDLRCKGKCTSGMTAVV